MIPARRSISGSALLPVLLFGCGRGGSDNGSLVTMYDNQFNGAVLRVPVGARVTFINVGRSVHNAVAVDGSWRVADVQPQSGAEGRGADKVFDRPGVYRYRCTYHGTADGKGMVGTIVVGDVAYTPNAAGSIPAVAEATGHTRKVPSEYSTIQAAVDAAAPGDLILIDRGVYKEEVTVTTPSLVLRGVDRNDVIIDGEFVRGNGVSVLADAVAVENMTARNARLNGFFWTGVTGFRGSYLTAYNNGDYGIYAFGATDGVFEHSYASGSPDSGFYVGQCYPCNTVLRDVIAENNALGFSGTNAGGRLYLVSSVWRKNGAGIVPSSLDVELNPPQRESVIAANLVIDNNNPDAPATSLTGLGLGNGILLAGSVRDTVERNVVIDHQVHGIVTSPFQDRNYYPAYDNVIRNNVILGSGRADLANGGPGAKGNCFSGNEFRTASPAGLQALQGCGGFRFPWWSDFVAFTSTVYRVTLGARKTYGDWQKQPAPSPQPSMPEASGAPARIAMHVFDSLRFDLAKAELPAGTDSILAAYRARAVPSHQAGLVDRILANASFLVLPVALLWWIGRARRSSPGKRGPLRRWSLRVIGATLVYAVVLLATSVYFGRM